MSNVAIHFASGGAFFSGSACLLAGLFIVTVARRRMLPATGRLLILMGLFLIGMSATPLPVWAWCLWVATFVLWAALRLTRVAGTLRVPSAADASTSLIDCRNGCGARSVPAAFAVVGCTLAAALWELSWQLPPRG